MEGIFGLPIVMCRWMMDVQTSKHAFLSISRILANGRISEDIQFIILLCQCAGAGAGRVLRHNLYKKVGKKVYSTRLRKKEYIIDGIPHVMKT